MIDEEVEWPEDDWVEPDVAGGFSDLCKSEIEALLSPYFEHEGLTAVEIFGAAAATYLGVEPATPDLESRARVQAEKERAVAEIAATVGGPYETVQELGGHPATFFNMVAKAARYHRPRSRPRGR